MLVSFSGSYGFINSYKNDDDQRRKHLVKLFADDVDDDNDDDADDDDDDDAENNLLKYLLEGVEWILCVDVDDDAVDDDGDDDIDDDGDEDGNDAVDDDSVQRMISKQCMWVTHVKPVKTLPHHHRHLHKMPSLYV